MNRCHMPSTLIKITITEYFLAVCSVSNIVRVPACVGKRTDERFGVPYGTGSDFGDSCKTFLLPPLGYRSTAHCSTLRVRQELGTIQTRHRAAPTANSLRCSMPIGAVAGSLGRRICSLCPAAAVGSMQILLPTGSPSGKR